MAIYLDEMITNQKEIFVFGSNLAGRHGAGAAHTALDKYGAVYGEGVGHFGLSYAIPTKDMDIQTMSLNTIKPFVDHFIGYAKAKPHLTFKVTALGTGLAGISHETMANLFKDAPDNCQFDSVWKKYLPTKKVLGNILKWIK